MNKSIRKECTLRLAMPFPQVFRNGAIGQTERHYTTHCDSDVFDAFCLWEDECTEDSSVAVVAERIEQYFGVFMRYYRSHEYRDERNRVPETELAENPNTWPTPEEHDAIMVPAMNELVALQTSPHASLQHTLNRVDGMVPSKSTPCCQPSSGSSPPPHPPPSPLS